MRRLVLALALLASPLAHADALLRVRARTKVEITSIRRSDSNAGRLLEVHGILVDAASNQPLGEPRTVALGVEGDNGFYHYAEPVRTDGTFEFAAPLHPGRYTLKLYSAGDAFHEAAEPIVRSIDLDRVTPILTLGAPERASAAQPYLRLDVATSDPGDDLDRSTETPRPVELPVELLVDDRPTQSFETHGGRTPVDVPTSALGKPGHIAKLTVRFEGDELHDPAETTKTVQVTTPTELTLSTAASELALDGTVELAGQLVDATGPVAGATVALLADADGEPRPLAMARTDDKGRFRARVEGASFGQPGERFVEARFQPAQSFRDPSRSPSVTLRILAAAPHPLGFWLSPMLTLLAIAGVVLARRRPWRAIVERRETRRRTAQANASAGLTANRPPLLSALRPAADLRLSGQVLELPSLAPLPTATVTVGAGEVERIVAVDEAGRFSFDELPAGPIEVTVEAPGYVAERFARTLPHRGELRDARVALVPIREKIFATYRRVALPLLPEPRLAETWTPRELLVHMHRRRLVVDELAALTRLVESACFGARLPDSALLAEAERLATDVERAERQLTARG